MNKEYIESIDKGIAKGMATLIAHEYAVSRSMRYMSMYDLHDTAIFRNTYYKFYERKLKKLTNKYLGETYEER